MKTIPVMIFCGAALLTACNHFPNEFSKVTELDIEYLSPDGPGQQRINLHVGPGTNGAPVLQMFRYANKSGPILGKVEKDIRDIDLELALTLANDRAIRAAFLSELPAYHEGESGLWLRISQNAVSISYCCRSPFKRASTEQDKRASEVAAHLFRLADLPVPDGINNK